MAVAPLCRVEFEAEHSERLGKLIKEQTSEINFLLELKSRKPRTMGQTVILKLPQIRYEKAVHFLIKCYLYLIFFFFS